MQSIIKILILLPILIFKIEATDDDNNNDEKFVSRCSTLMGLIVQESYTGSKKVNNKLEQLQKLVGPCAKVLRFDQICGDGAKNGKTTLTFVDQDEITFGTSETILWTDNLRECCGFSIHKKNVNSNGVLGHLFPYPFEVTKDMIETEIKRIKKSTSIDYTSGAEAVVIGSMFIFSRFYRIYEDPESIFKSEDRRYCYIQNTPSNVYDPLIMSPTIFPRSLYINTKTGEVGTIL